MATNITFHPGVVSHEERAQLLGTKGGVTVWLTGLSASGKSTIAVALEQALLNNHIHAYRLDGDNIRFGLNKDLGFSQADRVENIRRIGEVRANPILTERVLRRLVVRFRLSLPTARVCVLPPSSRPMPKIATWRASCTPSTSLLCHL